MMILDEVDIGLPVDTAFQSELIHFLSDSVEESGDALLFPAVDSSYVPRIKLSFGTSTSPQAIFKLSNQTKVIVPLVNTSGQEQRSHHEYNQIEISEIKHRLPEMQIVGVDHLGINLPWFDGIHPEILRMRRVLSKRCLYHLFPSGEAWDFILPGTESEISGKETIDYNHTRRPKFEIVSFDKCSTPLIQTEILVDIAYDEYKYAFPEGIAVDEARQVWLYVENLFTIDFCIVLNEASDQDWSGLFKGNRLL